MAELLRPPRRFTHPEWTYSNNGKYRSAELERQAAERLENECDRLIDETTKRTEKSLQDVDKKFDQRIDNVKYWKGELDRKLGDINEENSKFGELIKRIEKALESTVDPLHISHQCLINRENRQGIDLVHDDVQKELLKEVEVHQGVQALLQKTLEQVKEQLRLNRKAEFQLKKDVTDKLTAQNIDEYCRNLKKSSSEIGFTNAAAEIDPNSTAPEEWQNFTNDNIMNADRQLQNSVNLRSLVDGILQQVCADQRRQVEAVNVAFRRRISEMRDAKGKLEEHLARVLKEISNQEDNIRNLEVAIFETQAPLKLAETRLEVRQSRPGVEKCRDPTQFRLVEEVGEIRQDVASLSQRLSDAKKSLKALTRRQLDLEEEIQIKANSLFIDDVQCMGIRDSISIQCY